MMGTMSSFDIHHLAGGVAVSREGFEPGGHVRVRLSY